MKIAIVTGGFEGVRTQLKRWRLEQEAEDAARIVTEGEQQLVKRRQRLAEIEAERDATPTKEKK